MVENERKFVLPLDYSVPPYWKRTDIYQYYLPNGTRMRAENDSGTARYTICRKTPRPEGGWIENESAVTLMHFMNYNKYATTSVMKTRFSKQYNDELWCIDKYTSHPEHPPYFVLAECEMPEDRDVPEHNPLTHILYQVPVSEQTQYSAKALADVNYAIFKLKEISLGS